MQNFHKPVEHTTIVLPVVLLQVNYSDRISYYALADKDWNRVKDKHDNKCFVAVWKLRKVKPYGPKPPPSSSLIPY